MVCITIAPLPIMWKSTGLRDSGAPVSIVFLTASSNFSGNSQKSKQLQGNFKTRSIVLFSLELEYSSHLQFLVPMPGVQATTRRFQHQVHSSIPTRIRVTKSLETNNENPTTEDPHSNVIHSIQETTKPPRPPIQVSLINFVSDLDQTPPSR